MSENEQKAGCVDGLRELIAFVNGKCSNEEAGRKCLGFIMLHGAELEAALSPARSGEAVAWLKRGGKVFVDSAHISREHAERSAANDKGAEVVPLGVIAPRNEVASGGTLREQIEDQQRRKAKGANRLMLGLEDECENCARLQTALDSQIEITNNERALAERLAAPRNESSGVSPGGRDSCAACDDTGSVFAEDGSGPWDCYRCGRTVLAEDDAPVATPAPQDSVRVGGGAWRIDHSTPSPILVYENCSVIQDEQAEYVLRLIEADLTTPAPAAGADGGANNG